MINLSFFKPLNFLQFLMIAIKNYRIADRKKGKDVIIICIVRSHFCFKNRYIYTFMCIQKWLDSTKLSAMATPGDMGM